MIPCTYFSSETSVYVFVLVVTLLNNFIKHKDVWRRFLVPQNFITLS